jgi:hypothetical protein
MAFTRLICCNSVPLNQGDPSGKTADRESLENETIVANSNAIQELISKIFKNHEEFFWKKSHDVELPKLKYPLNLNIFAYLTSN